MTTQQMYELWMTMDGICKFLADNGKDIEALDIVEKRMRDAALHMKCALIADLKKEDTVESK